jgi:hypothetical protein
MMSSTSTRAAFPFCWAGRNCHCFGNQITLIQALPPAQSVEKPFG